MQGRSLAGCRQSVTFGAALLIIQRVERLLEVALADLVGSGHAVDHRRGVGVVLAIFDHLVGKAEQRVQPPHPAKRHLPQPVGQAILHKRLKTRLILDLFRIGQAVFLQELVVIQRRIFFGFGCRIRRRGIRRRLLLLQRFGHILAAGHLFLAAQTGR